MPLFGASSPFDPDVEKITNEANTSEDWARIMDLCDKINNTPNSSKDALKSILKRVKSPVPHVAIQSVTLLNACVNNCGKPFQQEVSSSDFCTEARNIISKGHSKVAEKLKQHLQEWAEEYKSEASLSLLMQLYSSLKSEGHSFPKLESKSKSSAAPAPSTQSDPNIGSISQESQDLAKAIELSLQEEKGKSTGLYPTVDTPIYATVGSNSANSKKEPRKVKALYDFEAVEDNELTFKAGEIISVLDDSDVNWWKGENFRGIGLFPSNFVTADLTAETEPEQKAREKKVSFDEEVKVKTIEAPEVVEINDELLDQCLAKLQNCDPTEERADPPDLLVSEDSANRMAPLIDQELEGIDRDLSDYSALNHKLLDAFAMYHDLMKEAPVYGYSLQTGNPMFPPGMYPNQAMGAAGASMGQFPPSQQYHPAAGQVPGAMPPGATPYAATPGIPGMVAVPPAQGPPPSQGPVSQGPHAQQGPPSGADPSAMYSNGQSGSFVQGPPPPQSTHGGAVVNSQTPLQYHSTYSTQQTPISAPGPQGSYHGPPGHGSPVHPGMYQQGGQPHPGHAPQQQQMMM